jgi:hypothetical protein
MPAPKDHEWNNSLDCEIVGPQEDGAFWLRCKGEGGEWALTHLGCPSPQAMEEAMAFWLASRETGDPPA